MPKGSGKPRPLTAYNFYMKEKRKEILDKNPDMKAKEVMKEVGRLWKEASEEEKEKYNKLAEEDRARAGQEESTSTSEKKSKKKETEDNEEEED